MDIVITRKNASYDQIVCGPSLRSNISSHFSYELPNARFTPAAKTWGWDGLIKLFDGKRNCLPAGLREELIEYLNEYDYEFEQDELESKSVSLSELKEWAKTLNLPSHITPFDDQLMAIVEGEKRRRALFLAATNAGKTLIQYLLFRWFDPERLMIVVPRAALVNQLKNDFIDYGCNPSVFDEQVFVTTWQSVYTHESDWFEKFDMICCDEAHNAQAKSISYIMNSSINAHLRFGLTGSLSGAKVHEMVLRSHFGQIVTLVTNKEMIEQGRSSKLKINIILLKHTDSDRKISAKKDNRDYATEMEFICNHPVRNKFLANLAAGQDGNSFLIFKRIAHGEELYKIIESKTQGIPLFFAAGSGSMKSDADEADLIRKQIDSCHRSITLASLLFFSEGTNIKNLNDIIFGAPSKSRIKTMQAIGRGFRISDRKNSFVLWDIADDLSWKTYKNHTMKHLMERISYYEAEGFDYEIFEFQL